MRLFSQRSAVWAFWSSLLILLIGAVAALAALRAQQQARSAVSHTRQALEQLDQTLATLDEVEAAQRTYLLTGHAAELDRYRGASSRLSETLAAVGHATADNPRQQRELADLRQSAASVEVDLNHQIDLFEQGRSQAAVDEVMNGHSRRLMADAHDSIERMRTEESRLLVDRIGRVAQQRVVGWVSLSLPALLALLLSNLIRNAERARLQLSRLVEQSGDVIALADLTGRITYLNPTGHRMLADESATAWEGRALGSLFERNATGDASDDMLRRCREGGVLESELQVSVPRSSLPLQLRCSVFLIRDPADHRPLAYGVVARDITERKQHEAELQLRGRQLQTLLDQAPLGMYLVGPDFRVVHANPIALRTFGDIDGGVLGRNIGELLHIIWPRTFANQVIEIFRHTLETGEPYHVPEVAQRRADSEVLEHFSWRVDRIPFGDGGLGLVCYTSDISMYVQARQAVAESDVRFRTLADNIPQLAWMTDASGAVSWYNQRWFDYTGTTPEQVKAWGWRIVHHPDHLERVEAHFRRSLATGEPWEDTFPLRAADGSYRWFLSRAMPIRNPLGSTLGWFGTNTDITDRYEMQAALAQSEQRYRQVLEALPQLVWTCSPRGEADFVSRQWMDYTGTRLQECLGRRWVDYIHPEDRPGLLAKWEHSVRYGAIFDSEVRIRGADGVYRWFKERAVPLRSDGGAVERWFGTSTEITDLVEARETVRRANALLEQRVEERTRKLEEANAELQAFAQTIAHDLRAPLRTIHGYATAIIDDEQDRLSEEGAMYARRVAQSATRLDELIQDLLAYSRLSRVDLVLERIDLTAAAAWALEELEEEISCRRACVEVQGRLPAVLGHRTTVNQVLINLISNAIKFVPPDVQPRVTLQAEQDAAAGMAGFIVADNGIGIEAKYHQQIFRVFERLHSGELYPGTGIGLAIVRKAVERMGGLVHLNSAPGQGSRFIILLQAASGTRQPA